MRALIVIRLSRLTDASTSPERQLAECRKLCDQRGYEVVGIAEDLDTSAGTTTPFDRPRLGGWLNDRLGEFDVIVTYRMDRIVRKLLDLADLIRWCQNHEIKLVSATEAFLDLTQPFGDIVALLVAKVAEMELSAISERNRSAAQHNLRAGKYRGGVPPWGYLPSNETGEWRLVQDAEQVQIIRDVVARVLDGEPLRSIAHDLTERAVPTPRDRFAISQKRQAKGYGWHSGPLKRALTSPTLLGYAMSGETPIRNEDGSPVVRTEPILTREQFDRIGKELSERENRREPTKRSTSLLVGVIYCGVCGRSAYRLKGGKGRNPRYRCSSAQYRSTCGNRSIPLAYADDVVEQLVTGMLGESERLERVWDVGSDHSAELEDVNAQLEDLTGLVGVHPYLRGTPQRGRLDRRIEELAVRQAQLASQSIQPSGWTWVGTGEVFNDWWSRQTTEAKNVWLRSMNVTLGFSYTPEGQGPKVHLDMGALDQLASGTKPAGPVAYWQEIFEAMRENGIAGMEVGLDGEVTFTPRAAEQL